MRRICGMVVVLVLVATSLSVAVAQSRAGQTAQNESPAEIAAVLDHIWLDAAYNHDTGTMAWLFAKDFVEVHPGGEIVNGQQQIEQIKDPKNPIKEIHPDDIQVRYASPDVVVLTDTTTIRSQSGTPYGGTYRVIRVFVKQQGRWRAAGAGITAITPPK
jgi:uncharacterized protein (TIGR02246 family)